MSKSIVFAHKQKIAFVASGGAVKAACFHIGVCLALERKGIHFWGGTTKQRKAESPPAPFINTYVGSSAGSIIASLLASGYSLSEIIQSFLDSKKEKKKFPKMGYTDLFHIVRPQFRFTKYFQSLWERKKALASGGFEAFIKNHLVLGGVFTTTGIEKYLREKALPSNKFEDLVSDLFIVATQLDYSRKSIFSKYKNLKPRPEHQAVYDSSVKISEACAASTALPPIYHPYPLKMDGETVYYYDGEIRETLSTHVAKDIGCDLVIASYTHQPYHFRQEVGSLADYGINHVMIQAIYQAIEQKIHTSRRLWQNKKIALDTVNQFFKDAGLSDSKRAELCALLEEKLQFNKDTDYVFIHPLPNDYRLFMSDHFNLSEKYMIRMVKSGFKAGIYHLRDYEFHE